MTRKYTFTKEECDKWKKVKDVNPKSRFPIDLNSKKGIAKQLEKQCKKVTIPAKVGTIAKKSSTKRDYNSVLQLYRDYLIPKKSAITIRCRVDLSKFKTKAKWVAFNKILGNKLEELNFYDSINIVFRLINDGNEMGYLVQQKLIKSIPLSPTISKTIPAVMFPDEALVGKVSIDGLVEDAVKKLKIFKSLANTYGASISIDGTDEEKEQFSKHLGIVTNV